MIKHMIIQVLKYLKQENKVQPPKQDRTKATLSLEAYDLYIFSPFGKKLPKSS